MSDLIIVILPVLAGTYILTVSSSKTSYIHALSLTVTIAVSLAVWAKILAPEDAGTGLAMITEDLVLYLRLDSLGRFFAGLVSLLWPFTVIYAFGYLRDDEKQNTFFGFFTMAYGVTLGVSMSGNLFTLYCFYELLTLSTVPLVMHTMTRDAIRAARTYFAYSLGGAAFAFASMLFFTLSGELYADPVLTRAFWLAGFFGFGVKAALFPLHKWLPKASVAPTPVTALLHAVAVVKSGVFAIIRLTWYAYGPDVIRDTPAQYIALAFAAFTILYGSSMAVRETHLKRRLAYSTVANLSYIIFGVMLLTPSGLAAALAHMAFHAVMKILLFFCAGNVTSFTGREFVRETDGLGTTMKLTFAAFTLGALSLTGIPPLPGFVSKWMLLEAASECGGAAAYIGAGAILISAFLTAVYSLTVVRRAYFPSGKILPEPPGVSDRRMTSAVAILAVLLIAAAVFAGRLTDIFTLIAESASAI